MTSKATERRGRRSAGARVGFDRAAAPATDHAPTAHLNGSAGGSST